MKEFTIVRGLIVVAAFQVLVLAGEYLISVYPLWTGDPVILEMVPVDPRSLFRGNYAKLNYEIARLEGESISDELVLKKGDVAYLELLDNGGVFRPGRVSRDKPGEGLFIRGRVTQFHRDSIKASLGMHYGIEAYFAPKERALEIESKFRERRAEENGMAYAKVYIASTGKAALDDILWELP